MKETDTFSIPYTSGSTGKPKGVMLSHRARILNAFTTAVEHGCYTPSDRALGTTPMFHFDGSLQFPSPPSQTAVISAGAMHQRGSDAGAMRDSSGSIAWSNC